MKKSQLYTLGGALLASTALAGVANAATVGRVAVTPTNVTSTAVNIANTLFSGTASTANALNFNGAPTGNSLAISFVNTLPAGSSFNATINVSGATFNNPAVQISALARSNGNSTFAATVEGACGSVTPLTDKILLSNCIISGASTLTNAFGALNTQGFTGGLKLSGVIFSNASGLATAGTSISLSGTINDNGNPSIVLENITSGAVVTSAAPVSTTVTAGSTGVTNPATTPTAFTNFSSGGGAGLTLTLATVNITGTASVGTNLAQAVTPDGNGQQAAASSVTITVTSASLTDDATTQVRLDSPVLADLVVTPAGLTSGSATFSLTAANQFNGTSTINAWFDGTHAINAADAGTVAVAYGVAGTGHVVAAPSGSGSTSSIVSGGFSAEFNTALASGGDFQSFIRIHNNGTSAGAVTITVKNEADGTTLGTMTTSSLAVGQTIQLSAADIESGAGITSPSGTYTIELAGPIIGYAQHVLFNATTGQFSDLSSFRNGGSNSNVP